jgi:hypothetical protein
MGNQGDLTVGEGETSMVLIVIASLRENPQIKGSVVVQIPTVIGVRVVSASASVDRGGSLQYLALAEGFALTVEKQGITWSVTDTSGNTVDSAINESGVLSVAADETAAKLTVTATSNV